MDIQISFNDPVAFIWGIAYVVAALVGGYYAARLLTGLNPPRTGDERMGLAVLFFFLLFLAAVALVATVVMLFIGHAQVPFLIALALVGAAFGAGSRS